MGKKEVAFSHMSIVMQESLLVMTKEQDSVHKTKRTPILVGQSSNKKSLSLGLWFVLKKRGI